MQLSFLDEQDNKNGFYPTPSALVLELLKDIKWEYVEAVLEPSAGKGNIAEKLWEKLKYCNSSSNIDLDCIEIDPNLRHILTGKGYRVVHNDFLTFNSFKDYSLIAMNPPFSNCDEHLLHAIEIQEKHGGQIVCILNSETLKNAYTNRRKLLHEKLKQHSASIRFMQNQFIAAERKTGVEIALIHVNIPRVEDKNDIFEDMRKAKSDGDNYDSQEHQELNFSNFISALVRKFEVEVSATQEFIKQYRTLERYMLKEINPQYGGREPLVQLKLAGQEYRPIQFSENNYMRDVRMKYWQHLLNQKQIKNKMTSKMLDEYRSMTEKMADYDFTEFNIKEVLLSVHKDVVHGVQNSIIWLFDKLSYQHAYHMDLGQNIHYFSGWKTNKAHMVNVKKVILPVWNVVDTRWARKSFQDSVAFEALNDIEKAFNYLNNGETGLSVDLSSVLESAAKGMQTKNIQCKYFKVDIYQKGTIHIKFNEDSKYLVERLNIHAAQNKGWLPPGYGKKAYKDMNSEEKETINSFQGAKEYQKVMDNQEKYLYQPANIAIF